MLQTNKVEKFASTFIFMLAVCLLPTAAQTEENLLTDVLKVIFENIFKPNSMSVSIITNISGHGHFKSSQLILDPLMRFNKEIQVPVAINQYTTAKLVRFIQAKLIFSSSSKHIKIRMEHQNKNIQSISTKYVIILNTQDTLQAKLEEMHQIFQHFFNFFILDVVVLISHKNLIEVYTYEPYSSEQCASTTPVLLQSFKQVPNDIQYHDLYPEKNRNFHQCAMKVVLWHLPPAVVLKKTENNVHFTGLDVDILKDLAQFLNFSIEFMSNEPEYYIGGTVFPNRTAVGVFKILAERRANLTFGFILCGGPRRQLATGSYPYFINEMVILLKNSQKYTPLQLLLRPYSISMWFCIISIIIFKNVFGKKFFTYFRIRQSFYNLLLLQWLYVFFIIRISYEGSMYKAICSSPYHPLPQSLNELVTQNYALVTDYATGRILTDIDFLQNITTIVPGNPNTVLELIDTLPPKTGILTYAAFLTTFMAKRQRNFTEYATIGEKVTNTLICAFLPQFSPMTPSVNILIRRYAMFGITEKLSKDHGFQNLPLTTDQLISYHNSNTETPLDFNFLKTIFWYYFLMTLASIVVFFLELLSMRCKNLTHIFVKLFDKLF